MSGQGARHRRRMRRQSSVGPEIAIAFITLDRKYELLACGHEHLAPPPHPNSPYPPLVRRCPDCPSSPNDEVAVVLFEES